METISDQFLFTLAHEIRNPLTNINLSVQLLKSGVTEMQTTSCLNIIERSAKRINTIINEFFEQHHNDKLPVAKYSIQELLDEVLENAMDRLALKNIRIVKNYHKDDYWLRLNRAEIGMALTNIVINAIDAMIKDEGILELATSAFENSYMVKVEDNGCGIKKADLPHIFKPYFTDKPGGLGIGLAQTKNILASNNVHVHVESKEGEGTSFMLFIEKAP